VVRLRQRLSWFDTMERLAAPKQALIEIQHLQQY
jgi:hypothetical protein